MNRQLMTIGVVIMMVASGASALAPADMTLLEQVNAHVMLENVSNGFFMIQQEYGIDPASSIGWSGTYSDDNWTAAITGTLYGTPLVLNYTGALTGGPPSDVTVDYSGTGSIDGTQTITINGFSQWHYDGPLGAYVSASFEDQGTVDTPKLKWWHKALEALGGGVIGGMAGGIGGVLGGAQAGVSLSKAIFEKSVSPTGDPPNPPNPGDPALPQGINWEDLVSTPPYNPSPTEILTRVFGDGNMDANVRNVVAIEGTWAGGSASGTGQIVPEPGTLALLGIGGLMLRRKWRK